jgi:hypothetical protein
MIFVGILLNTIANLTLVQHFRKKSLALTSTTFIKSYWIIFIMLSFNVAFTLSCLAGNIYSLVRNTIQFQMIQYTMTLDLGCTLYVMESIKLIQKLLDISKLPTGKKGKGNLKPKVDDRIVSIDISKE